MRLAILLIWLLSPISAYAVPAIAGLGTFLGASAATAFAVGAAALQIGLTVAMTIYGNARQRRAAQAQKDAYNNSLQNRTITSVATDTPYVYVYGRSRVGSAVRGIFTTGDKDQYKHVVCVHAAHECDAIEEIYISGKALGALDAGGNVTSGDYYDSKTNIASELHTGTTFTVSNTPDGGQFTITGFPAGDGAVVSFTRVGSNVTLDADYGTVYVTYTYTEIHARVSVQKHLGVPGDGVDSYLHGLIPSLWPTTATLSGFCYTIVTLDLNQPEFQGGLPSIEVLLRGKKLYDPRTGTTYWSQNPALAIYDYLTSELCGVDAADIPTSTLIASANDCDASVSLALIGAGGVTGTGPRYTLNGTVTADQPQQDVLNAMADAMAGGITSTSWNMWAGIYTAPILALDQSDIVGKIAITPGVSDADLFNGVKGQFSSNLNNYVTTDYTPYQNSAYKVADGRDLWHNMDMPFTDNVQRVWNIARIFTEDQRNSYTVNAEFSLKAWSVRVGDRVSLTSSLFGWSSKVFRVVDKKYSPTAPVELTLKEDDASIWDFVDAATVDETPNTNLQNPFVIDPLESITCTSGTDVLLIQADGTIVSRIKAVWPLATTQAVLTKGEIEVQWQEIGATNWEKMTVAGSETGIFISPVSDGVFYTVRARTVNLYLNTRSDWTYSTHKVIGKTEPPPNITDLAISGSILNWTPVDAIDLAGYVFRFHYGSNLDWGTAAPLHNGLILQSPFDLVTRPGGTVAILGKAVDTSGNESLAAAVTIINLGDPYIANVVETIDLKALSFPGQVTGGSVISGDVVADSADSAYGTDDQSFYGQDSAPAYDLSSFAKVTYISSELSIGSALAGSVATLDFQSQGTDLSVDYRFSSPSSVYGPDNDSAYGADSDSFYDAPGAWIPWPGQIVVRNDVYQFRVTVGAGPIQGKITTLSLVIDAPDIVEDISDLGISATGTAIPYTKAFTSITNIQATLQAGTSGAVSLEIDKTNPLAPSIKAYDSSHSAVSGAAVDIRLKGY